MDGMSQTGPWRACRNSGDATWPLSAGCSRRYSEPASRPARRSDAVRSTRMFACSSSRTLASKNRLTEKVEHGGDVTIAA
eukprot:6212343-Pleurochrysis_carterae.AAC.2